MKQRTWFVAGVSSGFGREFTEQLLNRGDRVIGTVRDTKKVTDLVKRFPQTFHAEILEMTTPPAPLAASPKRGTTSGHKQTKFRI